MIVAVCPRGGEWDLLLCDEHLQPVERRSGAAHVVAEIEEQAHPRWVWAQTASDYPALLSAGVRVQRCHDLLLTERILLSREDRHGEPAGVEAVLARRRGERPEMSAAAAAASGEPGLFDSDSSRATRQVGVDDLLAAYLDQLERLVTAASSPAGESIDVEPGALRTLIAAESASALVAAEMGAVGLPFDAAVHDRTLSSLLGERPSVGSRPPALAVLAARISEVFGHPVNPDSATELREAFRRAGFGIDSTRSAVLSRLDHPAVAPTLHYKELQRLHSANGWAWLDQWVRNGRFHPQYLAGGVISGRWATQGGGGLQIPKVVRTAVRADPGCRLVVADAAQLEPRVLIAVSGDQELARLAAADDLYVALAGVGFSGDRSRAKSAMIGAMYGATAGEAGALLSTLRSHFPAAMEFLETAAARGERGKLVTSVLGRTSHRPGAEWQRAIAAGAAPEATAAQERRARELARSWGRFTRNFVIQASAADWASVWLSTLRRELRALIPAAELVLFQHDELLVHVPASSAATVADLVTSSAAVACRLAFPHAPNGWKVPVRPIAVECYADAK